MPPAIRRLLDAALKKAQDEEAEHRLLIASCEGQIALAKPKVKELQAAIKYIEELNAPR